MVCKVPALRRQGLGFESLIARQFSLKASRFRLAFFLVLCKIVQNIQCIDPSRNNPISRSEEPLGAWDVMPVTSLIPEEGLFVYSGSIGG